VKVVGLPDGVTHGEALERLTASIEASKAQPAPATHSDEWHARRSTGIGASEVATICGVGRWGSRWSTWAEKVGLLTPDPSGATEAMDMGRELEPFLAGMFTKHTGLVVAGEQMMLNHPEHTWARATVDGMVFDGGPSHGLDPDMALGGFEAKYDNGAPWTTERCDTVVVPADLHDIPPYYLCQAAWQMFVAGWDRVWFGVLHGWGRYRIYEVTRETLREVDGTDPIPLLFEACRSFWFDNVLARVAPALDGGDRSATAGALAKVYGEGGGGEVDVDDLAEQLESIRRLDRRIKAAEDQRLDLCNGVKARLGDAEVGLVDGRPLVKWTPQKPRRRLDEKALRARLPRVAARFTELDDVARRFVPLTPCPSCDWTGRAQDVAAHMKKHPNPEKEN